MWTRRFGFMSTSGSPPSSHPSHPSHQAREARLQFTPSYALVGVYRLCTDTNLYSPVWAKVKHGVRRGGIVALIWTILTFNIQRAFVRFFLSNSPRVTGLSEDKIFGYELPVDITTYATVVFLSSQANGILYFFLARNLRIARERAWDQTVKSRGKGPEFWGPYVEEWESPPEVTVGGKWWPGWVRIGFVRFVITRILLAPLNLYPVIGTLISSWLKAMGTSQYLHKPYFAAKKMTPYQVAVFMEERKWDYRAFGFVAAFLEGFPIVGLAFSISNRVGAAMWAHDLEKRQHLFASGDLKPLPPRFSQAHDGESLVVKSHADGEQVTKATGYSGDREDHPPGPRMAGSWVDVDPM